MADLEGAANYAEFCRAMRLLSVCRLEVWPHEDEDISLIRLLAIAVMRGRG